MRTFIFISFVYLTVTILGCKRSVSKLESPKDTYDFNPVETKCLDKNDKEKLLESIFETEEFQMFLHPEIKERLPIRLVKNEFITSDLVIFSNGQKVQLVDSLILPIGTQHRVKLIKKDCNRGIVEYSIFYPIEGVVISGSAQKKGDSWTTYETTWGEKD